jgi:hypothetical protein
MIRRSSAEQPDRGDHAVARRFAESHGLQHAHSRRSLAHQWDFYPFGVGGFRRAYNVVHGSLRGRSITAFEYFYVLLSDSVDRNGYQRDATNWFLVCVVDLEHPVPPLAAVRTGWLDWHEDELPGSVIDIDHEKWSKLFTLVGDEDFGRAVVSSENAARCAEADLHAEWRFVDDELLLWVWRGRVDDDLVSILDVAEPLIAAAERYRRAEP